MATFDWPADLTPQSVSWGIVKAAVQHRSPMAGSVESLEFPGQFWRISVTIPQGKLARGSGAEAFFSRLAGGFERVRVPYWTRLQPRGTLRGFPVLNVSAARGDLSVRLSSLSDGMTLERGDMFGLGPQLFQVFDRCVASGGALVVPLVNRVRGPIASGTAVVWDRPTVTCCVPSLSSERAYSPRTAEALPVQLEEV